jgi:aarF domain-containing kinase
MGSVLRIMAIVVVLVQESRASFFEPLTVKSSRRPTFANSMVAISSPTIETSSSSSVSFADTKSPGSSTRNEPEVNTKAASLNIFQRLNRALSFYSAAVPIFVSYKGLSTLLDIKRQLLGETISAEEENKLYDKLHDFGSDKIVSKINELKGFYVKTGQIISTRVDIFPTQYTSKLAITQDKLDPLPAEVIKEIVRRELLNGAELSELFSEFDDIPLGSASIAQVHRARLLDGRIVAVKVQRPSIEAKLLGDIANLKNFAKLIGDSLFIDYYKVFCELERTLVYELDFLHEALATTKLAAAVAHSPSNKPQLAPVRVPLPIPGLVTKHVLVMEFMEGKALSQLGGEMEKRGVVAGSPESKLFGGKLLQALTDAYGSMIFGSGIIHGDPHPGNIFVQEDGTVVLLDCGQVKEINTAQRLGLARVVCLVNRWEIVSRQLGNFKSKFNNADVNNDASQLKNNMESKDRLLLEKELSNLTTELAQLVRSFGVTFKAGAGDEAAAAVAILLFGNTDTILPGGYAGEEISLDSPIVQVQEFPSELVLLGRATVMMKGIANRLRMSWGLSDRWRPLAQEAIDSLAQGPEQFLPVWSVSRPVVTSPAALSTETIGRSEGGKGGRIRFRDVKLGFASWLALFREYLSKKVVRIVRSRLPQSWQKKLFSIMAKWQGY